MNKYINLKISDYYITAGLYNIPSLKNREFAIIKDEIMYRHFSFDDLNHLRCFLVENAPDHVYYSSAIYDAPNIRDMGIKKRGWLSADLIFDVDYDHLKNKTLNEAKKQILKLISILQYDFGLNNIMLVFSGRRGYHAHIRDSCIQKLGSAERSEIADYFAETYQPHKKVIPNPNFVGIDAQVTSDVTRLIRLPGSLHGGSGKICEIIPLDTVKIPLAPKERKKK